MSGRDMGEIILLYQHFKNLKVKKAMYFFFFLGGGGGYIKRYKYKMNKYNLYR